MEHRALSAGLCAALLFVALPAPSSPARPEGPANAFVALRPEYRPAGDEARRLDQGKVVVRDLTPAGARSRVLEALGLVDADLARAASVLSVVEEYPRYLPNVERVRVYETEGDVSRAEYYVRLQLGILKRFRLELLNEIGADRAKLNWRQIPWPGLKPADTIVDTRGYWLLEPYAADPSKVLLLYHLETDPGDIPLGLGWIVDALMKHSLPGVVEAARLRIDEARK